MQRFSRLIRQLLSSLVVLALVGSAATARATLTPGDVAIIGWIDNDSPDSFAFVTLAPVSAGEVVYFTDNGWTGTQFRSPNATDGDGNETLTKWESNVNIAAGTIIRSTDMSANYTWTQSGLVPGAATGSFAPLSIGDPNEQIYAFQGPTSLPLQGVTNHLYVLDDTNGFENAVDSSTGNVPPGLTLGVTAITLDLGASRFIAFNTSSLASGNKGNWWKAIALASNWTSGDAGTLPSGTINVVPEPSTLVLVVSATVGLVALGMRRRLPSLTGR